MGYTAKNDILSSVFVCFVVQIIKHQDVLSWKEKWPKMFSLFLRRKV